MFCTPKLRFGWRPKRSFGVQKGKSWAIQLTFAFFWSNFSKHSSFLTDEIQKKLEIRPKINCFFEDENAIF
jgi:hypothetical protein